MKLKILLVGIVASLCLSGCGGDSSSNSSEYPWENDENIPDLDWDIPGDGSYPSGTEGDTGENGDTWTLPEYTPIDPPFADENLNIPPMPEMNTPEMEQPVPEVSEDDLPELEYEPETSGGGAPAFPGVGD